MIGVTWPSPSRWVIATWPDSTTNMPGPGLPVSNSSSPCLVAAHLAEPPHAVDLVRRQRRKGLLVARKRGSPSPSSGSLVVSSQPLSPLASPEPEYEPATAPAFFRLRHLVRVRVSGDADPASLRPRACDFRRLRFSRSASFSRCCRESLTRRGLACRACLCRRSCQDSPNGDSVAKNRPNRPIAKARALPTRRGRAASHSARPGRWSNR